ncbi:MerR family transcriptional regulator [Dictyobacter kobayashii]|uniref:MerR family transcriptional regulator n=1 Tax=Dictyobacter kobayashii TaxID=2014872 RepID=A0A402ARA4_9CHLR|nr:MerR family transcriptional regulator [Dictyobacter kobayashii]GCE21631.1 MerR family transcriptional regulator [Dictyobacter kobayashii]
MYLTMQEVAELTGISAYTIRFYEKSGILPRIERSESGIRRFSEADVACLRYIADFKKTGMALEDIAPLIAEISRYGCILNKYEQGEATEQSVIKRYQLLREQQQRLLEQRENLDRMLAEVGRKLERYERHFAAQSALAASGASAKESIER